MASNDLAGILRRLEIVERSTRFWKLTIIVGWSGVAVCLFAAADDGDDNSRLNKVVDTLNARAVPTVPQA